MCRRLEPRLAGVAASGMMSAHTVGVMGHNVPSQGGESSEGRAGSRRCFSTAMPATRAEFHRIQPD